MRKRFVIFLFFSVLISACTKKDGNAIVGLTVVNEKGIPIQNCNVKLTVPGIPENTWGVEYFFATTNEDGYIEFTTKVNAYYDVYVWKGYWEGCGFVEFVPNEQKNKEVIIYPPGTPFNGCL